MNQEIWVATSNKNKLKEMQEILKDLPFVLRGAFEIPNYHSPPETGQTFEENAKIKARSLKTMRPAAWILSDDSGLEVNALGGLPGVHSARYAGPNARDIENNLKLLKQIQLRSSGDDRSARFKCVICLISPEGEEKTFEGILQGAIAKDLRGKSGFGYDPLFVPQGETQTLAELGLAVKNRLSHRFQALKLVKAYLAP